MERGDPRERRSAGWSTWGWLAVATTSFFFAVAQRGEPPPWTGARLVALVVAGVAALCASRAARRAQLGWIAILAGALTLRAVAWWCVSSPTDDAERYVWESRVVLAGHSPYALAPSAPELAELRDRHASLYARVAHPDVPASYPPLAQVSFVAANALAALVPSSSVDESDRHVLVALRALALMWDVLLLWPLARVVRARGEPLASITVWAWSPLVALEFAGAGHFDALALLAWWCALAMSPRAPLTGAAALGVGAAVKFLPLASLPFLARDRKRVASAVVVFAVLGASFAPLAATNEGFRGLFTGLGTYVSRWESTSLLFRAVDAALRWPDYSGVYDPRVISRGLVALAWCGCAFAAWRARLDAVRSAFVLVTTFLLLSPTLHPWYVTWCVPFLALHSSWALRWLVCAIPLQYAVIPGWRAEGVWSEPVWLWPTLVGPLIVLALLDLRRTRSAAR